VIAMPVFVRNLAGVVGRIAANYRRRKSLQMIGTLPEQIRDDIGY
jgi:hypothetical protein